MRTKLRRRAARARVRLALIAGTLVAAAAAIVPAAVAYHQWNESVYHSGYLAPQQGASTGYSFCNRYWGSRANWSATPWEMTAALINTSGGWVASARSGTGHVGVTIDIGPVVKAHCKNAENTWTFSSTCRSLIAYFDGGCA